MLNILQIQHFYYVGLHGGISAAARAMPERRTQAAISKAMTLLEADFGRPLFERTPFRFTPAGREFWDFVRRFFERLEHFLSASRVTGTELRVAGAEVALLYLSDILELLQSRDEAARLKLRSGGQSEMHGWLREGATDVLIAPRNGPLPPQLGCRELVTLPLALLVPQRQRLASAADLWKRPRLDLPLIVSSLSESVVDHFAAGVQAMRHEWRPSIDANSLRSVAVYVAEGKGLGVVPDVPALTRHPGVRAVPLPGFEPVKVMAFSRTPAQPLEQLLIETLSHRAARNWPQARKSVRRKPAPSPAAQ